MKISKDEVIALVDAVEHALSEPLPQTLRELRERAQTPDGPYVVQKGRDQRAHRIWTLVDPTGRAADLDDIEMGADRWYYERDDAGQTCSRVNAAINHRLNLFVDTLVKTPPKAMVCSTPGCNVETNDNKVAAAHEVATDFEHAMVTNAKWKRQQP